MPHLPVTVKPVMQSLNESEAYENGVRMFLFVLFIFSPTDPWQVRALERRLDLMLQCGSHVSKKTGKQRN